MDLTWQQVSRWAYNTTDYSETSLAALEWHLPVVGMNGDEVREAVQLYVSEQTATHGLRAVAALPQNLKAVIEPYFRASTRPQQAPRTVAGPQTQAAPAATNHTAGTPQGEARPVHQNALQRFFSPQPKPGQEGMNAWQLFWKNR